MVDYKRTYNTIDLDYCDWETLTRVCAKISRCPALYYLSAEDSMSKGFHLKLWCMADCDLCRFVFDDQKRYAIDFRRPPRFQNVLFDGYAEKPFFKLTKQPRDESPETSKGSPRASKAEVRKAARHPSKE